MDIDLMQNNVSQAAEFIKGLASAHRLLILCQLAHGEKSVTTLIEATHIAQTSMSQHLKKLKQEGLVQSRREHRTLYYSIAHEAVIEIMNVLYSHFCSQSTNDC